MEDLECFLKSLKNFVFPGLFLNLILCKYLSSAHSVICVISVLDTGKQLCNIRTMYMKYCLIFRRLLHDVITLFCSSKLTDPSWGLLKIIKIPSSFNQAQLKRPINKTKSVISVMISFNITLSQPPDMLTSYTFRATRWQ